MREVTKWGRSVGLNVWKDEYFKREKSLVDINEDDFYIGQVSSNNACCMILQSKDTLFWTKAKENEAGHIHKLCVRRKYSGIGLSQKWLNLLLNNVKKKHWLFKIRYWVE